jgi:hypothetical protein
LEGGDPPFGAFLERCDVCGGEAQAGDVDEVGGRLRPGEAEVGGADLGQLAAGAQAGQGEARSARVLTTSRSCGGRWSIMYVMPGRTADPLARW